VAWRAVRPSDYWDSNRILKAVLDNLPELSERQSETDFGFGANIPPYKANLFDAIRSHFRRGVHKP